MNPAPEDVRSGFLERYFRWAVSQWDQELASDFPTLRAFGGFSSAALVALEVLEALEPRAKASMTQALARRAHKEATSLRNAPLSAVDEELLEQWLELSRQVRFSRAFHLETYRMDRHALRAALKHTVGPLLGKQTSPSSGNGLGYVKYLRGWSVDTDIDLGGRNHQLAYFHVVSWEGHLVKSVIGPLEWLGISSTALNRVSAGHEGEAAQCVAWLTGRFVSAEQSLMP